MSEYQWVEFRAVDTPLNEDALKFMRQQSTRAEIDRYRFHNEYHYGDFHGDVYKMLNRGYDFHVHFANFGIRRIVMRFKNGFAFAERVKSLLIEHQIFWKPDKTGTGGILDIYPEADAESWDEWWELNSLLSDLIPIREMIMVGDMRPLFLLNLAFNYDDEDELEVPPGLTKTSPVLEHLAEFYEIDALLIQEAEKLSASMAATPDDDQIIEDWISQSSHEQLADELRKNLLSPQSYPVQLLARLRREAHPVTIGGKVKITSVSCVAKPLWHRSKRSKGWLLSVLLKKQDGRRRQNVLTKNCLKKLLQIQRGSYNASMPRLPRRTVRRIEKLLKT